ncbi:MAG: Hpt domain-containing protein [Planctomycetota bacterium]|nr:Hpt domain-containing protein [Planctomycetota bacterium]
MPETETLVDWEQARVAVGGDEQLLNSVIEAFLDEAPTLLAKIRQSLDERDATTLHRAAHTLKGTLSYFGNLDAIEFAQQLEIMGRQNALEEVPPMLAKLDAQLARVLACLTSHLGPHPA